MVFTAFSLRIFMGYKSLQSLQYRPGICCFIDKRFLVPVPLTFHVLFGTSFRQNPFFWSVWVWFNAYTDFYKACYKKHINVRYLKNRRFFFLDYWRLGKSMRFFPVFVVLDIDIKILFLFSTLLWYFMTYHRAVLEK